VILDELPGDQLHPDWSPDGSQLAFVQATDDATWDVWVSDPRGNDPEPLLSEYPAELQGLIWDTPAWSRDGSRIAMIGYEGNPNLELPTRSVLAIVDVATDEVSVPFDFALDDPVPGLSFPRWSPDGNAMALTVGRFDENLDFTGEAVAVTTLEGDTWSTPVVITPFDDFASRPDWHPTEDVIVFGTHDVGYLPSTDKPSNLFTVRPDGSGLTRVTDFGPGEERASQPTWTSDGRIIFAYVTGPNDEKINIAFINRDGSALEVVAGPDAVGLGNRPHPRLRPVP
jgi:Tol biopolymer transport system component